MYTLSKSQSEITNGLCGTLYSDWLVIGECMILSGDACMVDHCPCVGSETRHGTPKVLVNLHDFLY